MRHQWYISLLLIASLRCSLWAKRQAYEYDWCSEDDIAEMMNMGGDYLKLRGHAHTFCSAFQFFVLVQGCFRLYQERKRSRHVEQQAGTLRGYVWPREATVDVNENLAEFQSKFWLEKSLSRQRGRACDAVLRKRFARVLCLHIETTTFKSSKITDLHQIKMWR